MPRASRTGTPSCAPCETARARRKPVVFQKVGVTDVGAQAVQSHTASLAGADPVYEAAFRQFGAYRARDTDEMLDVAYAAGFGVFPESPRVALVSISGGVGVQMADAAVGLGLDVAPLSESAQHPAEGGASLRLAAQPGGHYRAGLQPRSISYPTTSGSSSRRSEHDAVVAFFTYVAAADGMVEPIRARDSRRPPTAARLRAGAVHRRSAGGRAPVRGGRLPGVRGSDPRRARPSPRCTGSAGSSRRERMEIRRPPPSGRVLTRPGTFPAGVPVGDVPADGVAMSAPRIVHDGGCLCRRTAPGEPPRRPTLGTGRQAPALREAGSAGGRGGAGADGRRRRARRRRVRRACGGQTVRAGHSCTRPKSAASCSTCRTEAERAPGL